MDIPASFTNALLCNGPGLPIRMKTDDIVIHKTRNNPKCASAVLLDMSGSMRDNGQYINVKGMGLALDGLIRLDSSGDFLQFIELYTFAKPRHIPEAPGAHAQARTIYDPWVRVSPEVNDCISSRCRYRRTSRTSSTACTLARKFLAVTGHAQSSGDADHRRPAHGPLRRAKCSG